jgi:hypothetical protein
VTAHPTTEQVALAWLRSLPDGTPCAANLPDVTEWFDTGFLTVPAVAGGSPAVDYAERRPVIQIDAYAANRASAGSDAVSRKLPLGRAAALATNVLLGTYRPLPQLAMPVGFYPAYLVSTVARSEVRRIPSPGTSFAHFSVDIEIDWIEVNPVSDQN